MSGHRDHVDVAAVVGSPLRKKIRYEVAVAERTYTFEDGLRDYREWRANHGVDVTEDAELIFYQWSIDMKNRYTANINKNKCKDYNPLEDNQILHLVDASFPLGKGHLTWERDFDKLKAYIKKYKMSTVGKRPSDAMKSDYPIRWAYWQRMYFKGTLKVPNFMLPRHFERLQQIGFPLENVRKSHKELSVEVAKFFEIHGHYRIPNGHPLYDAFTMVTRGYFSSELDQKTIELFEGLPSFDWDYGGFLAFKKKLPELYAKVDPKIKDNLDTTANDNKDYSQINTVKFPFHSVNLIYGTVGNPFLPLILAILGVWFLVRKNTVPLLKRLQCTVHSYFQCKCCC